jgi:hypothetical protein
MLWEVVVLSPKRNDDENNNYTIGRVGAWSSDERAGPGRPGESGAALWLF